MIPLPVAGLFIVDHIRAHEGAVTGAIFQPLLQLRRPSAARP
jgi:hypothetical protein